MRRLLIGMMLAALTVGGQAVEPDSVTFRSPFDFPLLLSANFGELRPNHFHDGIDIKTEGVTGKPIYSIADGYVSRVLVQHGGYGQAVYVTHPNGYTSVYGHIVAFAPAARAFPPPWGRKQPRKRRRKQGWPDCGNACSDKSGVEGMTWQAMKSLAANLLPGSTLS